MSDFPETGVGMIYLPGLENLIESHFHLLDVIEIEPQTLWYNKDEKCDSFDFNGKQNSRLLEYSVNKLFHSVGFPVGGSVFPGNAEFDLLNKHASFLTPLWISEHLSFNTIEDNGQVINTNFLLPPMQTAEGIDIAVRAINHFKSKIKLPFAFETGVNYLQQKNYEIPDGHFVSEIATKADCNILLDLHNIMANQINGRQSVSEFINQLPLERICEIHIAGGFFHNNYYLDAHSGITSKDLLETLERIVYKLPYLKALIFEMLPEYVNDVTDAAMQDQFEQMHRIWDARGKDCRLNKMKKKTISNYQIIAQPYSVRAWEYTLGEAAIGKPTIDNDLSIAFSNDDGLKIINELIFHFRASMVVSTLKLSTRLLRLSLGTESFTESLKSFFANSTPERFAYAVAKKYAGYLKDMEYQIPYLYKLVEFEMASLHTMIDNKVRKVHFDYNPFPVFRSLSDFQMPAEQDIKMDFVLTIKPDELPTNKDSFHFDSVFHN
jgi:uncharacterized protein (UPF0276 family)